MCMIMHNPTFDFLSVSTMVDRSPMNIKLCDLIIDLGTHPDGHLNHNRLNGHISQNNVFSHIRPFSVN